MGRRRRTLIGKSGSAAPAEPPRSTLRSVTKDEGQTGGPDSLIDMLAPTHRRLQGPGRR